MPVEPQLDPHKEDTEDAIHAIWSYLTSIKRVRMKSGEHEAFDPEKIRNSIFARIQDSGTPQERAMPLAHNATVYVLSHMQQRFDGHTVPSTSEIRDIISATLKHFGIQSPDMNSHDQHTHSHFPNDLPSAPPVAPTNTAPAPSHPQARRRRLNEERKAITHKFQVGKYEGYITVGLYDDTRQPGEIFLTMSKEGSMMSGLVDAFATSISIGLQYGVPLKVFVNKYANMRFEPSGITQNPNIPEAKSIVDYVFRWLALKFLTPEERQSLSIFHNEPMTHGIPETAPQSNLLDSNDTLV